MMLRRLRSVLLLFLAWFAFYMIQAGMSMALAPRSGFSKAGWVEIDASIAVLWTALSLLIAAWHLRARRIAPNIWVLIALHVPLFLAAAWADAVLARLMIPLLNPAAPVGSVWSLISSY